MEYPHQPVMVSEAIGSLVTLTGGIYVDATVGSGGHSETISKKLDEAGLLICLDMDQDAIEISMGRLKAPGKRIAFKNANFSETDHVLEDLGIGKVDGILLDLGMSSYQLDNSGRGFSFNRDEPLDMRMNTKGGITARELINGLPAHEIETILRDYGEEKRARSISKSIERERGKQAIETSLQLADLIRSVIPPSRRYPGGMKDPATRTFQALRIAVNKELENLKIFLDKVPDIIAGGGRLVFLTYHSLEDRLVKRAMAGWEKDCVCPPGLPECACNKTPLFRRLNKKGIKPGQAEIQANPRARSAILRAAERI
jgi:16S rRNA (cytosine1402-N4)-methyltransferase